MVKDKFKDKFDKAYEARNKFDEQLDKFIDGECQRRLMDIEYTGRALFNECGGDPARIRLLRNLTIQLMDEALKRNLVVAKVLLNTDLMDGAFTDAVAFNLKFNATDEENPVLELTQKDRKTLLKKNDASFHNVSFHAVGESW